LVVLTSPWSDDYVHLDSELSSVVVGDGIVSSSPGSDGVGSSVESPPLSPFSWERGSNENSVLAGTNVLPVMVEGSVGSHS